MTKKIFIFLSIAVILSFASFAVAKAQEQNQAQNQGEVQQLQEQNQEENQAGENINQEQPSTFTPAQTQAQNKGQTMAQQHRSVVANFVQELLHVADKEGNGIGEQVRTMAQQQNQSAETCVEATEKIQTRNRVKSFLVGSDYKNLGALRSEMVQTRNRLEQLNKLMENIQNEEDKLELQNQIQEMQQEQTRLESFVKEQEGKFSMFGWLFRFFNGYKNLE